MAIVIAVLTAAGGVVSLLVNVALLLRVLRGQADVQVKVDGHLAWYVQRTEQLHDELATWGIQPPPAPAPAPSAPGDTIAP